MSDPLTSEERALLARVRKGASFHPPHLEAADVNRLCDACERQARENARLRDRAARRKAALERYGNHEDTCELVVHRRMAW